MPRVLCLLIALACGRCADVTQTEPQQTLPPLPVAVEQKLSNDLESARPYKSHVWRDRAPLNSDGTVNGYVEIARGDSTKWEFRIPLNRREVDRMIPLELGGYPTNYGFLPRTISYDGDPADVLVLGPAVPGGEIVKGRIVGLMRMIDTGDLDSKVVISPLGANGAATHRLDSAEEARIARFFNVYKKHEGKITQITGWGGEADALLFLHTTAGFFEKARRALSIDRFSETARYEIRESVDRRHFVLAARLDQ